MNQPELIGIAWETHTGQPKEQRCYGTFDEDMPHPPFRFNILFVTHEGDFKMHSHEYCELVLVLDGNGQHITEQETYPLTTGDVFVISGNTRHGFKDARGLKLCNIQYDPDQFLRGRPALDKMLGYHALFDCEPDAAPGDHFNERLQLAPEQLAYAVSLLATLKSEFDGHTEGHEVIIEGVFLLLITYLSRVHSRQSQDSVLPSMRLANVISHVQKNFHEPLRIEELARIAHLSPSQFQRTFKRTYGTTPQKFIRQVRLYKACEMLKDPNQDITSIAYETGFSSSSFFTSQFKSAMGETPTHYRRKVLELQPGSERETNQTGLLARMRTSVKHATGVLSLALQCELTLCVML